MKQDRFLIGILVGIGVLVVIALALFFTRRDQQEYVADDTPEGVVHNYALAVFREEYESRITSYNVCYTKLLRIDPGTVHRLFFAEANGTPSRYHQPKTCDAKIDKTYDWSHVASGQVRLDMRMPEWTRYMFNAGQVMYDSVITSYSIHYTKLYDPIIGIRYDACRNAICVA